MITYRPVTEADAAAWSRLRTAFWNDAAPGEHDDAIARYFAGTLAEPVMVILAENERAETCGFVELSIRAYAEGCHSENVAYVEGWYVTPEARGLGIGRAWIAAAEAWARQRGCTELASDAQLNDAASASAHSAVGFEETGLIRCFRKAL